MRLRPLPRRQEKNVFCPPIPSLPYYRCSVDLAMDLPGCSRQIFECGYPPLCLDEWEGLQKAARVVCIRGRYTTYLDRETSSLFYHDEVSLV